MVVCEQLLSLLWAPTQVGTPSEPKLKTVCEESTYLRGNPDFCEVRRSLRRTVRAGAGVESPAGFSPVFPAPDSSKAIPHITPG